MKYKLPPVFTQTTIIRVGFNSCRQASFTGRSYTKTKLSAQCHSVDMENSDMENSANAEDMGNNSELTSSCGSSGSSWISTPDSDDNGIGTSINSASTTEVCNPEELELETRNIQEIKNQRELLKRERFRIAQTIRSKEGQHSLTRIEAERNLLIKELQYKLLLDKFRNKSEPSAGNNFSNIGSVTLSNVKLRHRALSQKKNAYFVCVLTTSFKLFVSQIAQADSKGTVNFNINHTFSNMPVDFDITAKIYVLTVRKKSSKKMSLLCCTHKMSDQDWYRRPQFGFWRECSIKISHLKESQEFILDLVQNELCKLCVDVTGRITGVSNLPYTGWFGVSRTEGLFWNQRWCVLQGLQLKYFNYPVEEIYEQPINIIDLRLCSVVRIAKKSESTIRDKCLVLEINENESIVRYYLSCESNETFESWMDYFQNLVPVLKIWDENGTTWSLSSN